MTLGQPRGASAAGHRTIASSQSVQRILEITWQKVLQVDEVDGDDNFFELGGTSLDAIGVIDTLNEELGTDISEIGLFERPTIRAMAELLQSAAGQAEEPEPDQGILHSRSRGGQRRATDRAYPRRDVRR